MELLTYQPSDAELEDLTRLLAQPGWQVYARILQHGYQSAAVRGIKEITANPTEPLGFYKGWLECIEECTNVPRHLVDEYQQRAREKLAEEDRITFGDPNSVSASSTAD